MIDTLLLARRKHPGSPNRLDDLCARYGIDNSKRVKHGALLDAEILADVYLELIEGRQAQLILVGADIDGAAVGAGRAVVIRTRPIALPSRLTEEDIAAHALFRASLGEHAIWSDYLAGSA
jgi:DNA polymerase-3 subunit epsilon